MTSRAVALAFEAGEEAAPFERILDSLGELDVKVTVFLDGLWAERNAALVQRAATEGHELANHGYGHPDWTTLNDDEIREDLQHVETIVRELTGGETGPWALPPLLGVDERVQRVLREAGYHDVNRYPVDGNAYPDASADGIRSRAVAEAEDGGVVTIHTGRDASAEAVPGIIRELRAAGFEVTTISGLGRVPEYGFVTPPHG